MKPGSSLKQEQLHVHQDKERQTCRLSSPEGKWSTSRSINTHQERTAWERSAWKSGLVFLNDFQKADRDSSRLLGSHPEPLQRRWCHIHSFIVLRLPLWFLCPLLRCPPSLSRCSLEGAFFGGGGRADAPGSHDLLPFLQTYCLLTALSGKSVQRDQRQSGLCLVFCGL